MRLFILHVIAANHHGKIFRNIERVQQRGDKRRRLIGNQRQRQAFGMQRAERIGHRREQETALFRRFGVIAVKQFTQNAQLLVLRNIMIVDGRLAHRRT